MQLNDEEYQSLLNWKQRAIEAESIIRTAQNDVAFRIRRVDNEWKSCAEQREDELSRLRMEFNDIQRVLEGASHTTPTMKGGSDAR